MTAKTPWHAPAATSTQLPAQTAAGRAPARPFEVRLPGFVPDQPVGLGDAVKALTSSVGVRPCGGCAARAQALNRWLVFKGRGPG
jgi:hypothetical protein